MGFRLHTVRTREGETIACTIPPRLHDAVAVVMDALDAASYRAYVVGGCVRDVLLGQPVHDVDVATDATPEHVMALFDRTVPTGVQHGTVTVVIADTAIEVTTMRADGEYTDGRRPDHVVFVGHIDADLSRRDFTMNAMAIDREGTLYDPFGGLADAHARILRAVGMPHVRFAEDALRMLRAIRFAAAYALDIDQTTWDDLMAQRHRLRAIAMERVSAELDRMVLSAHAQRAWTLLAQSGLLAFTKVPISLTSDIPSLTALASIDQRWACVLWTQRGVDALAHALRWSHARRRAVAAICAMGDTVHDKTAWCEAVLKYGVRAATACIDVLRARNERPEVLDALTQWTAHMPITSPTALAIDGRVLVEAMGSAGAWVGQCVRELQRDVVHGHIVHAREPLLATAVLRHARRTHVHGWTVYDVDVIDSTQTLAKAAAVRCPDRAVFVARGQHRAYGTQGKVWHAPRDGGLWMSAVVRPPYAYASWGQRAAAVVVAVCHALRQVTDVDVRIKWPNDIVVHGRKLCGILSETTSSHKAWVIGIGINGEMTDAPQDIPLCTLTHVMPPSWSWDAHMQRVREMVLQALAHTLDGHTLFSDVRAQWLAYVDTRPIAVRCPDRVRMAHVVDMTESGSVVVRDTHTGETTELFSAHQREPTLG
ncbi:MAG: CCA tRNA nucleotidyltransferase [Paenibacillaceae bacterium]|nr:CCA tRNA nucleotidyltransferase [Paenibacillaceae bacterium]